ncbi:class I fructose-bisphosphate aldolase [Chlorobium sp. N1]|uniref:class I fructose-bisphosphate aldolase n=1 Tax=Chlorobium sp. N1 TaxID=2491138 RepID=UPI0010390336|nr:class I fructose-bisphosphate aldolase [Chlorobium sp. N1]TCD47239.1 fructose-bisphosphate aldolase class I [Chlorobium sp. N1]
MEKNTLQETALALASADRGILAMDESIPTCNRRFRKLAIPETEEKRRQWRELIATTPDLAEHIAGAILFDETIRQHTGDGRRIVDVLTEAGIIPGIKVDLRAHDLALHPGEKITDGLDGLRDRLGEYRSMGARFTKWRAVITIGEGIPSSGCIESNAHALARFAALSQEAGMVPVVEPEMLLEGTHTMERCLEVGERVLRELYRQLAGQRVLLEGTVLKTSMVLPALDCPKQQTIAEEADATVRCLMRTVPAAVPVVAFLSGGQPPELAAARLSAINERWRATAPWALSFSFARAIQQPAMEAWKGEEENRDAAQHALMQAACDCFMARRGEYAG